MRTDPIDNIVWRDASALQANAYNPNMVLMPELRLIEHSILKNGWIQPILISEKGEIIDGFHRWRLSLESKPLIERYEGKVPCAVLDIPKHEAMMLTVRINRAKGTVSAVLMHQVVRILMDECGCDEQEIARGTGCELEEVRVLYMKDVFEAKNTKDYRYSKAWVPTHKLGEKRGDAGAEV